MRTTILRGPVVVVAVLILLVACTADPDRPVPDRLDLGAATDSDRAASKLLLDTSRRDALLAGSADPEQSAVVVRRGTRSGLEGERATDALLAGLPDLERPQDVPEVVSDAVLDVVVRALTRGSDPPPDVDAVTEFVVASGEADARRTWTALRVGVQQELTGSIRAGEVTEEAVARAGALDGGLVAARDRLGPDQDADAAAAFLSWSAAADATAAVVALGLGPDALLSGAVDALPAQVRRELDRSGAAGEDGAAPRSRSMIYLDVPYREQRLVVDAALAAGEQLALPTDVLTVGTPVPQLTADAPAETVEQGFSEVDDRLDLDDGRYADAFRAAFPPTS